MNTWQAKYAWVSMNLNVKEKMKLLEEKCNWINRTHLCFLILAFHIFIRSFSPSLMPSRASMDCGLKEQINNQSQQAKEKKPTHCVWILCHGVGLMLTLWIAIGLCTRCPFRCRLLYALSSFPPRTSVGAFYGKFSRREVRQAIGQLRSLAVTFGGATPARSQWSMGQQYSLTFDICLRFLPFYSPDVGCPSVQISTNSDKRK